MASAEEIRARVKRADEQRIATRANAAARVGEIAEERDELVGKLAGLTKDLGAAVSDALRVMTAEELAEFTGRQHRDIDEWTAGDKPRNSRRRPTANRPGRSSRSARPRASTPDQPAAEPRGATSATEPTGALDAVATPGDIVR